MIGIGIAFHAQGDRIEADAKNRCGIFVRLDLSFTPISRAYPFGALAFVFTVAIGVIFFRETVTRTHLFGLASIIFGVILISRA